MQRRQNLLAYGTSVSQNVKVLFVCIFQATLAELQLLETLRSCLYLSRGASEIFYDFSVCDLPTLLKIVDVNFFTNKSSFTVSQNTSVFYGGVDALTLYVLYETLVFKTMFTRCQYEASPLEVFYGLNLFTRYCYFKLSNT